MFVNIVRAAITAALFSMVAPACAQDARLTREEGRNFAVQLLRSNQPAAAKAIAESLLSADPQDPIALTLLSQAERNLGNFAPARQAGQAAWAYATFDEERFAAATVTAQALASDGKFTRAQFWLRRAGNFAPSDAMVQTLARDYATLQRVNPLQFGVQFGIAPSSNINNGSSVDSIEFGGLIFQLNPSVQNLSGYEISGSINLDYKVQQDERSRTTIGANALILRYVLTDHSRAQAPDFEVSDRAYNRLELFARCDWAANLGLLSAVVRFGASTLGDDPYSTETRIGVERIWQLSDTIRLDGALSLAGVNYIQSGDASQIWSGSLNWQTTLANDDNIRMSTSIVQTISDNLTLKNNTRTVGVTYDFGPMTETFDLSLSLGYQWRDFEPSSLAPFGREDRKTSLNVNIGFPEVEYYSFTPVVQLEAQTTSSNIARYHTEAASLDFSFRSSF